MRQPPPIALLPDQDFPQYMVLAQGAENEGSMGNLTRRFGVAVAVLGLMLGAPGRTGAALIIGNYPPMNDDMSVDLEGNSAAAGWSTPAGAAYTLDSATFRVRAEQTVATAKVELFGDSGGNP